MNTAILLALASNVFFATASVYFAELSRKHSAEWMNLFKCVIASLCFLLACLVLNSWQQLPTSSLVFLMSSGALGLMLGDIFLLKAFAAIGSGRTLMIFGFQPLLIGVLAFYLFHQEFDFSKLIAIFFMLLCLASFSLEAYKKSGRWESRGLIYALIGMGLDALGILLTRQGFEASPEISPFLGNFIRCLGALIGFALFSLLIKPIPIISITKTLKSKELITAAIASIAGTFVSLAFFLSAIKIGHLAAISSVAVTAPLFASFYEVFSRKRPLTPYLILGLIFFITGFALLSLL